MADGNNERRDLHGCRVLFGSLRTLMGAVWANEDEGFSSEMARVVEWLLAYGCCLHDMFSTFNWGLREERCDVDIVLDMLSGVMLFR